MMQWKKGDVGFEATDNRSDASHVYTSSEDRRGPGILLDHMIGTLSALLARVGVTSLTLTLALALVIATVVFGLLAGDAVALGQWCRKC